MYARGTLFRDDCYLRDYDVRCDSCPSSGGRSDICSVRYAHTISRDSGLSALRESAGEQSNNDQRNPDHAVLADSGREPAQDVHAASFYEFGGVARPHATCVGSLLQFAIHLGAFALYA
jgi:hypothetical protein